jgi:hypothetical protein
MTTLAAAQTLLTTIQGLYVTWDGCTINNWQVTAGEPSAPSGDCTQVSVWATQLFNAVNSLNQEDSACLVIKGVQLAYRIDVCYPTNEDGTDLTADQQLEVATCLYGLADHIWCGINSDLKAITGGNCADVAVDPLSFTRFQGGIVSAQSGLRFQNDCTTEPVS